jgi:RNA-directed DNA polymerase
MGRNFISRQRESFNFEIDIKKAHLWIIDKQEEIARAKRAGDLVKAEEIGSELVNSKYAQAVAVQTVATNKGSRSHGLSTEGFRTNDDYLRMMEKLSYIVNNPEEYSASPLDRIYIKKKDGRLRPISIPSYTDRCLQALYKLAVEPISEEMADLSSYGFRPIRSVAWATGRTLNAIANPLCRYGFVVEVDIMGCFDNINQDFILQITPLIPKVILKEWLECGYLEHDKDEVFPTGQGVPQGGILSPLLANLTLDGLELFVRDRVQQAKTGSSGSCFCRYADDMIFLVTTYQNAQITLEAIKDFLKLRGLQVKEAKMRITNIYDSPFEFLGFKFSLVFRRNRKRRVAIISIPDSAIRKLRDKINRIFRSNKPYHEKIREVNLVIRGWGHAYRFAHNSIYVFRSLRYWIWKQFHTMCTRDTARRLNKANRTEVNTVVMQRYFSPHQSYTSWPTVRDSSGIPYILYDISSIELVNPTFTNSARNVYIMEDREVLEQVNLRSKTRFNKAVLDRWYGCCGLCRKRLDINPIAYELHHILPRRFGGLDSPSNLVPLCRAPCHTSVSSAVQSKDVDRILQYISLGILEIPHDYLNSLTPTTE